MELYSLNECLRIQADGLKACANCTLNGKDKCGGQNIKETKRNDKGYLVGENGIVEDKAPAPPPSSKKKKKKKK